MRLRGAIALFLLIAISAFALPTKAADEAPLRVTYCQDCAPFQFTDDQGRAAGILIDFWRIWQDRTGRQIAWVPAPWPETLSKLRLGDVDAHAGLFQRPERDRYADFGAGILVTETRAFAHRELPKPIDVADLASYRVGVLEGDAVEPFLRRNLTPANVKSMIAYDAIMDELDAGRLKVFAADSETGLYHLARRALNAEFPIANSVLLYTSEWHPAVGEGDAVSMSIIDEGFAQVSNDDKNRVLRQWAGGTKSSTDDDIVISMYQDYAPMTFISPDGRPVGLLVDMWNRWAQQTGNSVTFRLSNWPETISSVREGLADIHSGLFFSEERSEFLDFSPPIHLIRTALYALTSAPSPNLESLRGKALGVIGGTFQAGYLTDNFPEIDVRTFPSDEAQVLALLRGEIDAIANEVVQTDTTLARLGYAGLVQRGDVILSNGLHAGVRKGHPGLLEQIRAGFESIPAADMAAIERRWLANRDDHFYEPRNFRLSDEEREWLEANAPLTVAVTNFIDPVDIFLDDGTYTGFNAALLELIEDRIEVEIVPQVYSQWSELVQGAMNSDVDMAMSMSITEERLEKLAFTEEYANDALVLVTRTEDRASTRFDNLADKRVGILKDIAFKPAIAPRIGTEGALVEFETDQLGYAALAAGEIDAYASSLILFGNEQRRRPNPRLAVAASEKSEGGALRFGVPRDTPILHRILEKALASIPPSDLTTLRREWLQPPSTPSGALLAPASEQSQVMAEIGVFDLLKELALIAVLLIVALVVVVVILRRMVRSNAARMYESRSIVVFSTISVVGVLGATMVGTFIALDVLERQTRDRAAESLRSMLLGRNAHVESWVASNLRRAELAARNNRIQLAAEGNLADAAGTFPVGLSEDLADMRVKLISILDGDGVSVLSSTQDASGDPIDWRDAAPEAISLVLEGQSTFIPPVTSAQLGQDNVAPNQFFAAPLQFGPELGGGALVVSFDDSENLEDILGLGQYFDTGETYAFDTDGILVSASRFGESLVEMGLVDTLGDEVLSLRVADPGVDLTTGAALPRDLASRPLTRMASAAIRGEPGVYVEGPGYNDYRGVKVFGAWLWNPNLNIGMATEIDVAEALGPFRTVRTIVLSLIGSVVLIGLGLTGFSIWIGRNAALSLARANQELEGRVKERTSEVVQKERQLRAALDNMGDGIYVLDADGRYTLFNQHYVDMVELPDDVVRRGANVELAIMAHASRGDYGAGSIEDLTAYRLDRLTDDQAIEAELSIDDGKRELSVRKSPMEDGGAVVVLTDVTDDRQQQRELTSAYDLISESIDYASNIQRSMLPHEDSFAALLSDHFVIWEPRDRVGGDIYWNKIWGDGVLIVLADCTGHGVPGAFMTLIATGALDRALEDTVPGEVGNLVQRIHQLIQLSLRQNTNEGNGSDDGLELGAIYLDSELANLTFAGARFSLFVAKGNKVDEIKGTKQGMAYRNIPYAQVYEETTLAVTDGASYYMTTDGLTDQVGGKRRLMFGKRRLKALLGEIHGLPMVVQETRIREELAKYQGDNVRRDDIAMIGIKV